MCEPFKNKMECWRENNVRFNLINWLMQREFNHSGPSFIKPVITYKELFYQEVYMENNSKH